MSRVPATARPTAILILSLILAACSETPAASSAEETVAPTPSAEASESAAPSESAEASGEAAVVTADSDLGAILTDAAGMTIYFFANDTEGTSNCEDDCLANWPAVEAEDSPDRRRGRHGRARNDRAVRRNEAADRQRLPGLLLRRRRGGR